MEEEQTHMDHKHVKKLPEEYHGKLLLLGVVICDDGFGHDESGNAQRYSVEQIPDHPYDEDGPFPNLCKPDGSTDKNRWRIVFFPTIEEACEAVLNKDKLGYDWDNGSGIIF